jgi:glycosyltransferase involved in cell wall biosynthesis
MKKLVYIIKSFAIKAGTERVISDKMNFLAEYGYDVTLVTYEQGAHPFAFPLHQSIRCHDLNTCFFRTAKYPLLKRLFLQWRLRSLFRSNLQSVLKELHPDYIIMTTYSLKLLDIIHAVKRDANLIVESHSPCYAIKKSFHYKGSPLLGRIVVLYDKWMLSKISKADQVITLTRGDAKEWGEYTSKVSIIPNPVTFFPEEVKQRDGCGRRIIFAGRLAKQKRIDLLVDAFALIAKDCPKWVLDIFGNGPEKSAIIDKIQHTGLTERVIIHPPSPNVFSEYQKSDFLVLSSFHEGFPLVLLEAMSCGIPCVAFKCKYGPEDIILEGENGFLAEDGNVKDLAEKMQWMMTHSEECLRMGKKARESMRSYKKEIIMKKWLDVFK